ncbi:MAG: 50S ribosomal protein L18Ae [Acidilobaceae archaeon]
MRLEVKVYRVEGRILIGHDRRPEWRKFKVYVRALKPEHALERVYSELGSRHKLKRPHIKVENILEVPLEEVEDIRIIKLANLEKITR